MANISFEDSENDLTLTEDESDVIITNLKDELIMESILEQISNPLNNSYGNTDYLDIFETRYTFLKESYVNSTTFLSKLENTKETLYSEIFTKIIKKFNLSYNENGINIVECTRDLYNFFILNYKDNIITFLESIILKEKKSLALSLKDPKYSKTLGVNALKKTLKNKEDALIISNIVNVIYSLLDRDFDNLEIIKIICNEDIEEATNYRIYQYFLNDFNIGLNNDFFDLYFDVLINKKENYTFIINEIKMNLLKMAIKK